MSDRSSSPPPVDPASAAAMLENAEVQWQESGAPWSAQFGDIYFSREGGTAETQHVFLEPNRLVERWQDADRALQKEDRQSLFTVAELGFGTGLNFLSCWALWERTAATNLRLHFISCEKYPLRADALRRALSMHPELKAFSEPLADAYPDHSPGYHRLHLVSLTGRSSITLDLYLGDAQTLLTAQRPAQGWKVDAWFLDGFAPRVNPEMWSDELLIAIRALSGPGTTASSYSVAGQVVRGLSSQGFRVEKRRGFGHKREMLFAEIEGSQPFLPSPTSSVIVIGAGLAGCSTAWQLAGRGYRVTVLDREPAPAMGASGNPQAVLQCRLNRTVSSEWHFNLQSFLFASRFYTVLQNSLLKPIHWHRCGVLTLDSAYGNTRKKPGADSYNHYSDRVLRRVSAEEASSLSGTQLQDEGLFLPDGGWLDPAALCRAYLDHPLITLRPDTHVEQLHRERDTWRLDVMSGGFPHACSADIVVIANSFSARNLTQTAWVPVMPLRGQVSFVAATDISEKLRCVVCAERYVAPATEGRHSIGASYVKNSISTELTDEEHRQNLTGIVTHAPELRLGSIQQGRAGVRGGTRDFMPVVGPVPDAATWFGVFGGAQQRREGDSPLGNTFHPGLYLNVGHGSHGAATTALSAEHLASLIAGEPVPLQSDVTRCIEPLRFVLRERKRRVSQADHPD